MPATYGGTSKMPDTYMPGVTDKHIANLTNSRWDANPSANPADHQHVNIHAKYDRPSIYRDIGDVGNRARGTAPGLYREVVDRGIGCVEARRREEAGWGVTALNREFEMERACKEPIRTRGQDLLKDYSRFDARWDGPSAPGRYLEVSSSQPRLWSTDAVFAGPSNARANIDHSKPHGT